MRERIPDVSNLPLDDALDCAASGGTMVQIAGTLSLTPRQFNELCKKHPIFQQKLKEAMGIGYTVRAESLPAVIQSGLFSDFRHLRVFVDTEKWLLSKFKPDTFGDKQTITHEYVDLNQALQDAKNRTIDVTPKPQAIETCVNPFADD
jgi:hypothetical protein